MKLAKIMLGLLAVVLVGCSPMRIVDYKTFDDKEVKGQKLAILFVIKNYRITKFDGKEVDFTPVLAGAYGGRHIYMLPGRHSITFSWGHKGPYETLKFTAKAKTYYELTSDLNGKFIIEQKKWPKTIPDSTFGYRKHFEK